MSTNFMLLAFSVLRYCHYNITTTKYQSRALCLIQFAYSLIQVLLQSNLPGKHIMLSGSLARYSKCVGTVRLVP